jgi:hypothetical protein
MTLPVRVPHFKRSRLAPPMSNQTLSLSFVLTGDALHFGIDCFGVCGDADGDGDPNRSSAALIG